MKQKLLSYLSDPHFTAFLEGYGLDPVRLKRDIEEVIDSHEDPENITVWWKTTRGNFRMLPLREVVNHLPTKRPYVKHSEEEYERLRQSPTSIGYYYFTKSNAQYFLVPFLTLAILKYLKGPKGLPKYLYPSIALIKEAWKGNREAISKVMKEVEELGELSPKEENLLLEKLSRQATLNDIAGYLEEIKRFKERRKELSRWKIL